MFNQKGFVVSLRPYLALTQAVRQGDLVEFNRIVKQVRSERWEWGRMVHVLLLFVFFLHGKMSFPSCGFSRC